MSIFQVVLYPPWRKMNNIIKKQNPNVLAPLALDEQGQSFWDKQLVYKKMCLLIKDSLEVKWY